MSIARDRANRSGSDPLQIDNTKLVTDSGDLKVQDASGNEKKLIADEIHVGTGADKVILKRDSSTGKVAIQTQASGEAAQGGTVASTTVYATTALLPTNPTDGQQALVTANNFMYIAKSNGWYKIAEITNTTPSITSAGNATYQFLPDGTPVSIEITATDAEVGSALQYKYVVSSGSIGSTATVTSSATSGGTYSALAANTLTTNKFFKVTPSTSSAHAGVFSLTFSASDGVAVATSSASSFSLQFEVSGSYRVGPYNADTDYYTFPAHADFNFGSNNFTIEAWVWPDAAAADKRGSWIEWSPDDSANVLRIFQGSSAQSASDSDNDLEAFYQVGGTDQFEIVAQEALTPNTWNHIALQRVSNTISLFVNGISKGSASYSGTVDASSWVGYLGMNKYATDRTATGYMSNVRVVNGSNVYTPTSVTSASSASSSYGMLSTPASLPSWGTTWTLETWIYITNSASYNTFFHGFGGYIALYSGQLSVYSMGGFSADAGTFSRNKWHHIALVNNSGSFKAYIDGVQTHSGTANSANNIPHKDGSGTLNMMAQGGNTWPTFGYMADTRLVIGTAVYSGNFTPPSNQLTKTGGTYPSTTNVNTAFPAGHTYLLTNQTSSGTTIADNSDQNYTLVTAGALTGSTTSPYSSFFTKPTDGLSAVTNTKLLTFTEAEPILKTNGSYYYDAITARLTTPANNEFAIDANEPFTFEMWYKFISWANSNYLFAYSGQAISLHPYSSWSSFNFPHMQVYKSTGTRLVGNANTGTALGKWFHVAVIRDTNDVWRMYIDGVEQTTTANAPLTDWDGAVGSNATIRFNGYGGSGYANTGSIMYQSDVRVVIGTAVYTGNFTPPSNLTVTGGTYASNTNVNTSIPSGHTKVLTAQNSSGNLVDNSSFNWTLTKSGTGNITPSDGVEGASIDKSSTARTISIETGTSGGAEHSYVTPFAQGTGGSAFFGEYLGANSTAVGTLIPTASSDFTLGTGDYCVDGWFKNTFPVNTSTTHNERLFDMGNNGCRIFFKNGEIKAQTGQNTQMTYSPGADFGTDTWHHFALQRESATTRFFLDGSEKTSISDTENHATNTCKIGGYGADDVDSRKFKGYITDFRIVKGATAHTPTTTASGLDFTSTGRTTLASHSGFDFGTNDFTVEFFYKWGSLGYNTLLDHKYTASDGFTLQSTHVARSWFIYGSVATYPTYESSPGIAGVWHHYAVVRNGNTVKMYRDGVETLSKAHTGSIGSTSTTSFGNTASGNAYPDTGSISNFRVVKGTALYTSAGFTPPSSPLTAVSGTALLLFQENSGSTLSDGSSNNVAVTKASQHTILTNDGPFYGKITVPTAKSTAISGTVLLTCQQSTGDFTDASSSNHSISQGATGLVVGTRHQPY